MQPYQRDPDIAKFRASGRAGRRNAVTEEDLSTIAAVLASQPADHSVTDTVPENASSTETRAANLPTDLSKLKFAGNNMHPSVLALHLLPYYYTTANFLVFVLMAFFFHEIT